jgi:hypothetical protein
LFVGKHPFLNTTGSLRRLKREKGEYEKVGEEKRYSSALINLMERMIDVV